MSQSTIERIRPYLEADEQILWVAKPDIKQSIGYELRRIGGLLVLLTVLAFGSITLVLIATGNLSLFEIPIFQVSTVCMVGISLASLPLVLGILWLLLQWSTTQFIYGITNQSFLWIHPTLWPLPSQDLCIRRFSLQEAYDMQIVYHRNGFGTLIFLGVWLSTLPRKGWIPNHPAFRAIPDVDDVVSISRQAAQQSGFVCQPGPPFHRQILQKLREDVWLYVIASVMVTIFSIAAILEMVGGNFFHDIRFVINDQVIIAGVILILALVGLIWGFRVQETLRRHHNLHRWKIVLKLSQAVLLLVWFAVLFWLGSLFQSKY